MALHAAQEASAVDQQSTSTTPAPERGGDLTAPQAVPSGRDRIPALAWAIAALFVAAEVAMSARYGFEQDELYFIAAGHHLAFGYVDQPPITPLLTRITGALGVSPTAVRIIPALAGGALVVSAARLSALFGAGRLGRVLASLATACAPVVIGAAHLGTTTPVDLLAWTVVVLCVATAQLRHRPRWWLGAGTAAGLGLENNNLIAVLVVGLVLGVLLSTDRAVLRTRWPWIGGGIAALAWTPNLVWQGMHSWPQLAMASALHRQNSSTGDYLSGLPAQFLYLGLLLAPLVIAGFIMLWQTPELQFIGLACTVVLVYVLAWVPGKVYYGAGIAPAVLAAGSGAAERWIVRGRRPRLRRGIAIAAPLAGLAITLPGILPVLPVDAVHDLPASYRSSDLADTIGWPQLTRAVIAQRTALTRAGEPPTSVFTGYYAEAAALGVLGSASRLPPVLSGHNAYWIWGPGHASDRTVLVVDALGQLRPFFARCRILSTYRAPYNVQNDWTNLKIAVCTGPAAGWHTLWPRLRHYD
jgi:4-amino-4-deoxy-L-arabinose transferase-like glycosyltransferase